MEASIKNFAEGLLNIGQCRLNGLGGYEMNEQFFDLSEEKRNRILDAGFMVFSQNPYKKASMAEVADRAGISKSLLFYYFKNKQEYYMYHWKICAEITIDFLNAYECYGQKDLFESMERGMQAKAALIQQRPELAAFTLRAFYEDEPGIAEAVQKSVHEYFDFKSVQALANVDPTQFREGVNLDLMYREMYWAAQGYLWELTRKSQMDFEQMQNIFHQLIQFWKKTYLKEEFLNAGGNSDKSSEKILREEPGN